MACRWKISVSLSALLLFAACATAPRPLSFAAHTERLPGAIWGIVVEEEDGTLLFAQNADTMLLPASVRKLFTSATVSECLGLEARLQTELWIDGEDVILRGDGDPSFGSERHESPGVAPFVDALRARGVTRVRDVIADVSRFDREIVPGTWELDDLTSSYAVPVDALAWDENVIGEDAVASPALLAADALRDALAEAGIAVTGAVRTNGEPRAWSERVAVVQSPYVYQLLATVLKNSHNLYAEMLLKRMTGSYRQAFELEERFLSAEAGISPRAIRFADGSGLSRWDLVTPAATVRLLRWMNRPERRGVWWTLLAQPNGEGTLRRRLIPLEHRFRGKTGTLTGVAALAGILTGSDGRHRYFAIVVNHHTDAGSDATAAIDAIVNEVANF